MVDQLEALVSRIRSVDRKTAREDDWEGWPCSANGWASRVQLVAATCFVTNHHPPAGGGIEEGIANSIRSSETRIGSLTRKPCKRIDLAAGGLHQRIKPPQAENRRHHDRRPAVATRSGQIKNRLPQPQRKRVAK